MRTILMNAGPWLRVPPDGYGGIENVVATMAEGLRARGHRIVLAGVAGSTMPCERTVSAFAEPQFPHIAGPYNANMGIAHAHMQAVVGELLRAGSEIDVVHDHLEVVGAAVLAALGDAGPPALQTLHWRLSKHPDFYGRLDPGPRLFFNALSERQLAEAPPALAERVLDVIPLAVPVHEFPFSAVKDGPVLVLARITPVKGCDTAARVCARLGLSLRIAGPIGPYRSSAELQAALDAPGGGEIEAAADVAHYLEDVRPLLDGDRIAWIGAVDGPAKLERLGRARALLCPVHWEEPGATAAVEALACGTPVIALRRGAYASIVDHGVTGFLADDEAGLAEGLQRAGDIDPAACRAAAERRFDVPVMAERYEVLYEEVISRSGPMANTA